MRILCRRSYSHLHLDGAVRIVPCQLEIFKSEGLNVWNLTLDADRRKWSGRSGELFAHRANVIVVDVSVPHEMDKLGRFQTTHVRDHARQETVAGNIVWNPQCQITTSGVGMHSTQHTIHNVSNKHNTTNLLCNAFLFLPLVHSARQLSICDIELTQDVAWRE